PSTFNKSTRVPTTLLNGTATYSVYHGRVGYLALKRDMPFHQQYFGPTSCFFASYANLATYKGYNEFVLDQKNPQSDEVLDYELPLIRDEIGTPTYQPEEKSRERASYIFRQFIYERLKDKDPQVGWTADDKKRWAEEVKLDEEYSDFDGLRNFYKN